MSYEQWKAQLDTKTPAAPPAAEPGGFSAWKRKADAAQDFTREELSALNKMTHPPRTKSIDIYGPQDVFGTYALPHQISHVQDVPQMAGGAVGGTAGAALGSPLGPLGMLGGGVLGGALGGASGKGYEEVLTGNVNQGTFGRMARAGLEEGAGELIGGAVGAVGGRLIRGGIARADMIPGIGRLSAKLKAAATRVNGAQLPPHARRLAREGEAFISGAQASKNSLVDTMESVAERSYGGGGDLYQIKRVVNPAAYRHLVKETANDFWDEAGGVMGRDQVAQMFLDAIGRNEKNVRRAFAKNLTTGLKAIPDSQIGDTVADSLNATRDAWRAAGREKYALVDEVLKKQGRPITIRTRVPSKVLDESGQPIMRTVTKQSWDIVPTGKTKAIAEAIKKEAAIGGGLGSSDAVVSMANKMAKKADMISFSQADDLRSFLLEEGRRIQTDLGSKSPRVSRLVGQLEESINDSMFTAAQKQSPKVAESLTAARTYWRTNSKLYNTPFVQRMAKIAESDNPARLADYIFARKAPERAVLARKVLGAETFNQARDTWLSTAVEKSLTDPRSIGGSLKKQLDKLGDETLDAMFGKPQRLDLYAMADVFAKEGKKGFENKMIASAVRYAEENPKAFIQRVFDPKNVGQLRRYKKIIPPSEFSKLKALWVTDALDRGATKGAANSLGESLNAFGEILNGMGPAMKAEMFKPQQLKDLKDIARLGAILGEPTGGGGGILAPLMEAGAVAGLLTHPVRSAKASSTVLGGLGLLGKVMSNERSAMWLVRGLRNPAKIQFYSQRAVAELIRAARPRKKDIARPTRPVGGHHF